MAPRIYIVAEEVGAAYWIEEGQLLCSPLLEDGTPSGDIANADATNQQTVKIAAGLEAMAELAQWAASNQYPRP